MKITEIISENNLQQESVVGRILDLFKGGAKAAGKNADTGLGGGKAAAQAGDEARTWQQQMRDRAEAARIEKEQARLNAEAFKFAMEHYGPEVTKSLKTLLLWETVIEYWIKVRQLHAKYPGTDEEDEKNPEFIKERTRLRGQMISQWLAPKVANMLLNVPKLMIGLYPLLKWGMGKVPYAGPAIVNLTKPTVRAAISAFLVSPAGGKWLTEFLGETIDAVGSLPTLMHNIYRAIEEKVSGDADSDSDTAPGASDGKDDAAGTSSGAAGSGSRSGQGAQGAQGSQRRDPNALQKVMPYDFSVKDILDAKK